MLYMNGTLHEKDGLMNCDELEIQTNRYKSCYRKGDFSTKFRCPREPDSLRYMSRSNKHTVYDQEKELVLVFIHILRSKAL